MFPVARLGFYLERLALGLVILSLLALAWPLFQSGFPAGHDGAPHVTYTYLFDQALHQGQFPVRWVELLQDGRSQPLFNFYQPGFYYLVQLTHLFVPSLALAFKVTIVLLWWLGALFLFLRLRRHGRCAAALAALLFAWSPYVLLDVFVRAAYPELAAIALAPVVLWAIDRYLRTRDGRDALVVSFCLAVMLLCHLPSVLILAPVFVGAALVAETDPRAGRPGRHWLSGAAGLAPAVLLACGMAAFYVMPALAEIDFIAMPRLTQGDFDFRKHFVYPIQWVRFGWGYGGSVPGPGDEMSLQIGIAQWIVILSAVAALLLARRRGLHRPGPRAADAPVRFGAVRFGALRFGAVRFGALRFATHTATTPQVALWLGLIALAMFLMIGASQPVWERVAPLAYVQFPWRFLMVLSLGTAFLGALLLRRVRGQVAPAALLIAAVGLHWLLYAGHLGPKGYLTASDYAIDKPAWAAAEAGRLDGFVEAGYTPVHVKRLPKTPVKRWTVAAGTGQVRSETVAYDHLRLRVETQAGLTLTLNSHWFPGWMVWLDGRPARFDVTPELGYLQLAVPPGTHAVEARLTDTPVRAWANGLSAVSAGLWLLLAATQRFWARPPAPAEAISADEASLAA